MSKFYLSEAFLEDYKNKKPEWGPLGEFVYLRTYSRFLELENRNEEWWETVKRVVEGTFNAQKDHCAKLRLPWLNPKAQRSAKIMFEKIFNFKFTPSGRGLWLMGTEFVEKRGAAALCSCAFISTEDIETRGSFAFTWTMDALMLGLGVGFDTKGAGKITIKVPKEGNGLTFIVPDSREGWVEGLELVIDAYLYGKKVPSFDFNQVRPYGTPIKGFGGVASGPAPLKELYIDIEKLLNKRIGEQLRSTDIVDIMNLIARTVIAGNVRRSAEIAFGDPEDKNYVTMKDPNKYSKELNSHRWASNNSVFAEVGKTDYTKIAESIIKNGEPGIIWLENAKKYGRINDGITWADKNVGATNPCGEIFLESSGLCNLVETFPSRHKSYEEYQETLKYAYLYGKTITLMSTHWLETNQVIMKNRRIGISQSGIIDAFVKHGRREMINWCEVGYKYLRELDEIYSNWLCIPKSIKITTTKPSGSVSLLPGVSPGIHYPHSKYYIRRVRIASDSSLIKPLREAGYHIEQEKNGTEETKKRTLVISFPIEEENFVKNKNDISMWEQVKNAVDYQRYWADNSVSITVTFKKSEADDIPRVLEAYEDQLKAISFLPIVDHKYEQIPYETINSQTYKNMTNGLKKVNFSSIITTPEGEIFCSNDVCAIPISKNEN